MNVTKVVDYCEVSAERKWETAQALYKAKRYADCLFFCHLALELKLKGKVVVTTKDMFPMLHDLEDLTRRAGVKLPNELAAALRVINTFNIAGRYDDYKSSFYKKATRTYAMKYFMASKRIFVWLKK